MRLNGPNPPLGKLEEDLLETFQFIVCTEQLSNQDSKLKNGKKVGSNQGLTRKESTIGLTKKKGDDLDFEVCM